MSDYECIAEESVDQWMEEGTIKVCHGDRLKKYLANLLRAENQRLREALEKLHHTLTRPGVIGEPHLSIVRRALQESGDE